MNKKRRKNKKNTQIRTLIGVLIFSVIPLFVLGFLLAGRTGNGLDSNELVSVEDIFTTVGVEGGDKSFFNISLSGNDSKESFVLKNDDPASDVKDKYANIRIEIPFGDTSEVLEADKIAEWVNIDEGSGKVTINEGAVKEYVAAWAKKHDTMGISRKFKTTQGNEITVRGGNYGWWTNKPETIKALVEMVAKGESGTFEPVYYSRGAKYGNDDIGDSYVEVNLDYQQVYVYKNGQMVCKSDCVSGKVANGNSTPVGTYAITYKERDATLVGEGYQSSVKYWMPFNGNIGLHDASWRDAFGGDLYLNGGSHGCINLPPSKAQEIYGIVEKGEAVIVYGGKQAAPAPELTEEEQLLLLQQQQQAEAAAAQAAQQQAEAAAAQAAQQQAEAEAANQEALRQQEEAEQQAAEEAPADQQTPAPEENPAPAPETPAPETPAQEAQPEAPQ